MLAKSAGACLLVTGVDQLIGGLGPARIAADAALYMVVASATGALRAGEIARGLRDALRSRKGRDRPHAAVQAEAGAA